MLVAVFRLVTVAVIIMARLVSGVHVLNLDILAVGADALGVERKLGGQDS